MQQPRSKAQPLIGYYDSDNPAVVRWHLQLAKAAGIEAFLVSWWGGANISGAAFEKTILPIAAEEKFKVALCSELAQFHHDVKVLARQMAEVLQRINDSPAYLRMDGKYEELFPHYTCLVQQAHAAGKKVFLPAHPGLDNSGIQSPHFIIPREDGATLRGYLRVATDAGADVVLLTSFNEWPETTIVEPSSSWPDPYLYLKILADWRGTNFTVPTLPRIQPQQPSTP